MSFPRMLRALALLIATAPAAAQDVVSYKSVQGAKFREYGMVITIDAFDCEAKIGKKCRMSVTVRNEGDKPEPFNATQLSIDDGKGKVFRAAPVEGGSFADLKKELAPGASAEFAVAFDGRIHFESRDPAMLKYANTTKLKIIR